MTGIVSQTCDSAPRQQPGDSRGARAVAVHLANALYLAATPTFALMAILTGLSNDPLSQICSGGSGPLPNGMLAMYLLMSVFHSPAWFKLLTGR
ncbi:hypothetical protein [Eoetvoesiella caeni]